MEPTSSERESFALAKVRVMQTSWVRGIARTLALIFALAFAAAVGSAVLSLLVVVGGMVVFLVVTNRSQAVAEGRLAPEQKTGRITVDTSRVFLDGAPLVRRERLTSGFVYPRGDSFLVFLAARPVASFSIDVPSREDARALLRALELDVEHKTQAFSVPSWVHDAKPRMLAWNVFASFLLIAATWLGSAFSKYWRIDAMIVGGILTVLAFQFMLQFWPTRVVVGIDGVRTSWLWVTRFVPFSSVRFVSATDDVSVVLVDGERVVFRPWSRASKGTLGALAERIREAREMNRIRGAAEGEQPLAELERGHLDAADWLRGLRALGGKTAYRDAGVSRDALVRVVEDPSMPSRHRAAAAAALGPNSLDDAARARIRVAAKSTASPRLRVALEAAGNAEETLAPLLEAVDEEDAGHREATARATKE